MLNLCRTRKPVNFVFSALYSIIDAKQHEKHHNPAITENTADLLMKLKHARTPAEVVFQFSEFEYV